MISDGGDAAVTDAAPALDQQLDSENRQLKATINALRLKLEETQAQTDSKVQAALAGAQAEIVQLRATINALRTEMERQQGQAEKRLEDAAAAARDENRHLRDMIVALRDQLEKAPA
jgi:chromosome segregation ATPase